MTNHDTNNRASMQAIANAGPSRFHPLKRHAILAILLIIAVFAIWLFVSSNTAPEMQYVTEKASYGNLTIKVSATGQLQPTNEVEVGSEVSGLIESVQVDENDQVRRGQVLATLDTAKLRDQVAKSRAAVTVAKASIAQAQATVTESTANFSRLEKVSQLSGGKVPSRTEMETAEATLLRAKADETSANASVEQAMATLRSDETNLAKASIVSPINGIVLSREVEPGQTVAASYQTPVLFTLAENLTQMQLVVDVDEADVGQVKPKQSTFFTVDAWPGRQYPAEIVRVAYGSETKDNVVIYKATLNVNNDDLTLRPGMTATAEITTASRQHVLLVPSAALRFTPSQDAKPAEKPSLVASLLPRPPSQPKKKTVAISNSAEQKLWVLRNNQPTAISVKTGLTDGRMTEIRAGELHPGDQVITESSSKLPK